MNPHLTDDQRGYYRQYLHEGKRDAVAGGMLGGCAFTAMVLMCAAIFYGAVLLWRWVV